MTGFDQIESSQYFFKIFKCSLVVLNKYNTHQREMLVMVLDGTYSQ
jgi:hypothetical protein